MRVSPHFEKEVSKALDGFLLNRQEILDLLRIPLPSLDAGWVMASADILARQTSRGLAEIHAQVSLNLSPCPNNCLFCSFASSNRVFPRTEEMEVEVQDPDYDLNRLRHLIHSLLGIEHHALEKDWKKGGSFLPFCSLSLWPSSWPLLFMSFSRSFLKGKKLKKRQDAALAFPYLDAVRWDRAAV
jgi:hypothetical protein